MHFNLRLLPELSVLDLLIQDAEYTGKNSEGNVYSSVESMNLPMMNNLDSVSYH